jgi:hypothetical protein
MILRLGVAFLAVEDLAAAAAPVRRWCGLLIGHPALLPAAGKSIVSVLLDSSTVGKPLYTTFDSWGVSGNGHVGSSYALSSPKVPSTDDTGRSLESWAHRRHFWTRNQM